MPQAEARASLVQEVIAKLNPPKKKETVTVVDLLPEKPQSPGKLYRGEISKTGRRLFTACETLFLFEAYRAASSVVLYFGLQVHTG
jgi:hypothetical protein